MQIERDPDIHIYAIALLSIGEHNFSEHNQSW